MYVLSPWTVENEPVGVPEWMATRGTKKGTGKEIEEGELGLVRTRAGPPAHSLTARDAARLDFRGGHGVRVRYVGDEKKMRVREQMWFGASWTCAIKQRRLLDGHDVRQPKVEGSRPAHS